MYFINVLFVTHSYDEATGTMDRGYPRSIEDDFPGMDDEVDAAAYYYGIVKSQISIFNVYSKYTLNTQHLVCIGFLTLFPFSSYRTVVFLPWKCTIWVQLLFKEGHSHPENKLHSQLLIRVRPVTVSYGLEIFMNKAGYMARNISWQQTAYINTVYINNVHKRT